MSLRKNQEFNFWKVVESKIWCNDITIAGRPLSESDSDTTKACILLHAMAICDLLPFSPCRTESNVVRWCKTMCTIGVDNYGGIFKMILAALRKVTEPEDISCFKRRLGTGEVAKVYGVSVSLFSDCIFSFLSNPHEENFRVLNTICSFNSRLTLENVGLDDEALIKYLDVEDHIRSTELVVPPEIRTGLNQIMKGWFKDYWPAPINPKHGPGGVSEAGRVDYQTKYDLLHTTPMIRHLLLHTGTAENAVFPVDPIVMDPTPSRVVFVPKGIDSKRTICMEPAVHQYVQQSVLQELMEFFEHHTHLRHIIKLRDSSQNKTLAGRAYEEQYCTIDLSSASDTVSWSLVRDVFKGTRILPGIWATRSRVTTLPDNTELRSLKFAPMGSALCFPVECLVFAACCEYVVRKSGLRRPRMAYSVYGDDIVIKRQYGEALCELLVSLGFILNRDKSFLSGAFYESCGGEFYRGHDVSPFRLPRKFQYKRALQYHPELIAGYVSIANRSESYNLPNIRRWIISHLLDLPERIRPLFSLDGLVGLKSPNPSNFHLYQFYNEDWQEEMIYCGQVIPTDRTEDFQCEYSRYFHWWVALASSSTEILPGIYEARVASIRSKKPKWGESRAVLL